MSIEATLPLSEQVKKDYDNAAISYNDFSLLPAGKLEMQLIEVALGNCTGLA
jgi:hypothetical protein